QLCLENPAQAVKEAIGKEIPQGFKLRFVENEGAHYTFVLPDMITEQELSESDLEAVAGGNAMLKEKRKNDIFRY
ncbi:hypothetical protein, partial [Cohnella sp.]|uniref:hypothetical protein n=1 Tax=Cohnella sp. TaxID=1883426 RepID=UPI0035621D8E